MVSMGTPILVVYIILLVVFHGRFEGFSEQLTCKVNESVVSMGTPILAHTSSYK